MEFPDTLSTKDLRTFAKELFLAGYYVFAYSRRTKKPYVTYRHTLYPNARVFGYHLHCSQSLDDTKYIHFCTRNGRDATDLFSFDPVACYRKARHRALWLRRAYTSNITPDYMVGPEFFK